MRNDECGMRNFFLFIIHHSAFIIHHFPPHHPSALNTASAETRSGPLPWPPPTSPISGPIRFGTSPVTRIFWHADRCAAGRKNLDPHVSQQRFANGLTG